MTVSEYTRDAITVGLYQKCYNTSCVGAKTRHAVALLHNGTHEFPESRPASKYIYMLCDDMSCHRLEYHLECDHIGALLEALVRSICVVARYAPSTWPPRTVGSFSSAVLHLTCCSCQLNLRLCGDHFRNNIGQNVIFR